MFAVLIFAVIFGVLPSVGWATTFDGTDCGIINESGSYLLNNNIEGAPISASPAAGTTCIRINVSDVVLDCNGYTITNNGTSGSTSGIFLFNSTNITVKNCPMISRYSYGVNLYFTNNSLVNNITLFNNSQTSILNTYSSNNILTSNNITSSTGGISISTGSINNTINDNNISFGSYGLIIGQNNANFFSSNQIFNNSVSGVQVIGSSNNTFTNNEVYNNGYGFLVAQTNIWETINNNFFDNNVYNNSGYGFNLSSSHNNTFTNNVVNKNQYGIILLQSENNSINSNTFCTNAVLDIKNFSTGNSGNLNRCDNVNNWGDTSNPSGCTYSCALPSFDGTDCGIINEPGSYQLFNDLSGAPVDAAPLFGTACVKINTSNVALDCNGHSITGSGSAFTFGILASTYPDRLTNVTVRNCPSISLYGGTGMYAWVVENSTFSNITSHNNTVGFYFDSGMNNTGSDNTAYNNSDTGFVINDEADTLSGNTAYNNTNNGFDILGSPNLLANNTAWGSKTCFDIESDYEILTNNTAFNCTKGFYVQAGYNLLANNTVYLSGSGFYVELTIYSNYTGNRAYNNTNGFLLNPPSGAIKCTTPPCSGFNNFVSNLVYNNMANGFEINVSGDNNNYTNNQVHDNALSGFLKENGVENERLTNNSIYNNAYGVYIIESITDLFFGNTIFNNTIAGVYDLDADPVQLSGDRFYNNARDFILNESANSQITLSLTGVIFDNPFGALYQNFTNLTISDIAQSEAYSINWSTNSTSLPLGQSSFARKFVDISNLAGSVSIDSINWTWLDSELTGYNEDTFALWKFNSSGWTVMNDTPNTTTNTLSLSSLNPASIYGILYQSTVACGSIAATVNEKNTSGKGKATVSPLESATVGAYSLTDTCVKSNQRNASAVLKCPPPSGSCVTASTGKCTIGSLAPGSYLVIVNSTRYAAPQSSSAKLVDCKTKSMSFTFNTALALFSEPSFWESGTSTILLVALVVVAGAGVLFFTRKQGPPEGAETPAKRYKPRR